MDGNMILPDRVTFELAQGLGPQLLADAANLTDSTASFPVPRGVCVCTKGQLPPPAGPYTQRMCITSRSITSSGINHEQR